MVLKGLNILEQQKLHRVRFIGGLDERIGFGTEHVMNGSVTVGQGNEAMTVNYAYLISERCT